MISSDLLKRIISLISSKTGIKTRGEDESNLQQKINKRIKALGLKDEHAYLTLLSSSSPASIDEWNKLISQITTGESYFFRDRGQIDIIRHNLLPNIIQNRKDIKRLNILSAGCSTGEEVYSLSIILTEIMPDLNNWHINLIGIDLNNEAVLKAKRGIFPEWSFRGVEPHYRSVFFQQKPEGWEVINSLKQMVKFYQCNLIEDAIPVFPIGSVDLIICRNVFIYFDSEKISLVVAKFLDLLSPGGYLITGHTELQGQELKPLKAISFPESMVFQMPLEDDVNLADKEICQTSNFVANFKELGQQAFNEGRYKDTIVYLQDWLNLNPQDQEALLLVAQSYGNQGNYQEASKLCHHILGIDPSCLPALGLLAKIAEEQGVSEEAKEYLRRMIYIDPNYILPYLDLIELHLRDREYKTVETLMLTIKTMENQSLNQYQYRISSIEENIKKFNSNTNI